MEAIGLVVVFVAIGLLAALVTAVGAVLFSLDAAVQPHSLRTRRAAPGSVVPITAASAVKPPDSAHADLPLAAA